MDDREAGMRSRWLLLAALALAGCQVGTYEVYYEDAVAAQQQEAVERGWVPEWLPEDTTDIHEIHDPATGARVLTATLAAPDAVDQHCPIDADDPPPLPFEIDGPPPDVAAARSCGAAGVAVVDGRRLVLWRAPDGDVPASPERPT